MSLEERENLEGKPNYTVPNLERGLMIIELLAIKQGGLTLTEIIELSSITKTSAFRIVNTLIFKNYLQKNESTKKITLSRKLLSLGVSSLNEQSVIEVSIDVMRALRDELKESVMLGALLGGNGVILEQVTSSCPVKLFVEQGTQFSLHSSVGGKSILAFLPSQEKNDLLKQQAFKRYTENTIVSHQVFKEQLKRVKQVGYAIDYGEDIKGINCVGAPIFNEHGYPVAAIWITAPQGRLALEDFDAKGRIVAKYANEISLKLGYIV